MSNIQPPAQITNLHEMFQMQEHLQTNVYDVFGNNISPREALGNVSDHLVIQHYKDMHIALVDELHEALGEIGWKPWASSDHFNKDAVKGELVDAFHFFMNLCLVAGVSAQDLIDGYIAKSAKNIKRQDEGYDGVSTKCKLCKRALDDDAVTCYQARAVDWDSFGVTSRIENYCAQQDRFYINA